MQKVQKTYTPEFKREAVRLAQTSGKPITQVARELGISDPSIHQMTDVICPASRPITFSRPTSRRVRSSTVLQDHFQQGATPLCFSTSNSTYVLRKKQEAGRDKTSGEILSEVVETAVQRFGGVDPLVNNAGIFLAKPFPDYTIQDVDRLVRTNLVGFFFVTQYAARQMRKQHAGHIANITTTLANQPVAGVSASIALLTKGGLNAVTKALAIEYAGEGIRVNAVAPGNIDTPLHKNDDYGFLSNMHPIARMGQASEIVDAIMYLHAATFVTGEQGQEATRYAALNALAAASHFLGDVDCIQKVGTGQCTLLA